jgi:hypothetical protein
MITELVDMTYQFDWDATRRGVAYLRMLFPEPAINREAIIEREVQMVM